MIDGKIEKEEEFEKVEYKKKEIKKLSDRKKNKTESKDSLLICQPKLLTLAENTGTVNNRSTNILIDREHMNCMPE